MISHVNYFKVGKTDDIRQNGWIKVRLMGWEIMVLASDRDFYAIEIGEFAGHALKSFLPDDNTFSKSGARNLIGKMLMGPAGSLWGKLHYFPVMIEDDFVIVGIVSRQ
jgi:nitrite reductase/ring-hydroxylating ferredoxin subunit